MPPWPICDPAVMKRMKGQAQAADPIPQPNARGTGPGLVGIGRLTASN